MDASNLVRNPAFLGGDGPEGWSFATPRPELAPGHSVGGDATGRRLVLTGTGDPHAFGCWRGEAALEVGCWYRASARVRTRDIERPGLSVLAQVARHFLLPTGPWAEETTLERVFRHGTESDGRAVELFLRAACAGAIEWSDPTVERIERPTPRMARVATVRFGEPRDPLTLEGQRERIAARLDEAGALRPDIVCLTEFCHLAGVPSGAAEWVSTAEHVPDGPLCAVLAERARMHRTHVVCGLAERDGPYVYNTAALFGREGQLVGRYRKTHLTFGELVAGVSPGSDYPVFRVDFGRVAIHICYDEWFPEVARAYAQAGAEVLFLPVVGGKPIIWRTRALDNGVYFVSSSWTPPSMIIDSSGAVLAETHTDGIAYADLDLDYRRVNWYVDPTVTYGMPTIAREMRNVLDDGLLRMLAEQWGVGDDGEPSTRERG